MLFLCDKKNHAVRCFDEKIEIKPCLKKRREFCRQVCVADFFYLTVVSRFISGQQKEPESKGIFSAGFYGSE